MSVSHISTNVLTLIIIVYILHLYTSRDHIIVRLPYCINMYATVSVNYSLKKAAVAILHHTINYCFSLLLQMASGLSCNTVTPFVMMDVQVY